MVQFQAKKDQLKEWFPTTYKALLDELRNSKSSSRDKSEDEIEWYVSWGFFSKKAANEAEANQKMIDYEAKLHLPYEERCKEDMPKIRISIAMKAGYRILSDRVLETDVPSFIVDMAYEVLKITMLEEQLIINDPIVQESLSEFQHLLDDLMQDLKDMGLPLGDEDQNLPKRVEKPLNMDEILDKINEGGIGSLTAKELKYLEKMSKG